jgi:hypothetical protein
MRKAGFSIAVALSLALTGTAAHAVPVSFTKLTGLTGGTLANTAVYKADLSSLLSSISSISITDSNSGIGGSAGQFSGFDLDAIRLSTTDCADAACAAAAVGLAVFDFSSGMVFTAGTQRAPADAKLFGTDATGTAVDNAVATLGLFDGESTTAIPGAFGFVSLGDGGRIAFNLTGATSTTGLFLYIGEVGDNGEVAAGSIEVSDRPIPEPTTLALLGTGLGLLRLRQRRREGRTSSQQR